MKNEVRSNVVVNLIRTITLTVLSFMTFPYACKILTDQYLGIYTWANTFVYYFLIIAKISIPNIAVRECVKVKDNPGELSKRVKLFFIIQAITTILSFVSLFLILYTIPFFYQQNAGVAASTGVNMNTLIMLLSINFLSGAFSFEWVYIALEKQIYMAIRSIIIMMLSAILIFALVKYKEHIYLYAILTLSVTVLTVLSNVLVLPKYIKIKGTGIAPFKPYLKPLLVLFSMTLVLTLYNQTDVIILGIVDSTKSEVGAQSVALKGIEIIITIITSLSAVFMPRATDIYNKGHYKEFQKLAKFSMNLCFFIAIPAIATMATMSETITGLISGTNNVSREIIFDLAKLQSEDCQYVNTWIILTTLTPMMLTYSIGDYIYSQILIPQNKEKHYLITMVIGVILNVAFSLLFALTLFKQAPGLGVAIGTALADIIILAYLIIVTRKDSIKAIFNINNLKIIIAGILVAIFALFVGPLLRDKVFIAHGMETTMALILELVLIVVVGAILYLGSLILMKEQLITNFIHRDQESE